MRKSLLVAALMLGSSLTPATPTLLPDGIPGIDFPVGVNRLATAPLTKAVFEHNRIENACIASVTVPSVPSGGTTVSFPINTAVVNFPFQPYAIVTFVSKASVGAGTGNLVWINGYVQDDGQPLDSQGRPVLTVVIKASDIFPGLGNGGGLGGSENRGINAGGVAFFNQGGNANATNGTNATASDWMLTLNIPAGWGSTASRTDMAANRLIINPPPVFVYTTKNKTKLLNWDFADVLAITVGGSVSGSSYPASLNPIIWDNCNFNSCVPTSSALGALGTPGDTLVRLLNSSFKFDWQRFAAKGVKVTASASSGNVLSIDSIPTIPSIWQIPGTATTQIPGVTFTDVNGNFNGRPWLCINKTRPKSMYPTMVKSFDTVNMTVTLNDSKNPSYPGFTRGAPIGGGAGTAVQPGDELWFVPYSFFGAWCAGPVQEVSYSDIDTIADFGAPSDIADRQIALLGKDTVYHHSILNNMGMSVGGHNDFAQKFNYCGTGKVDYNNNRVNMGSRPEDGDLWFGLQLGGVTDLLFGGNVFPFSRNILFRNNYVWCPSGNQKLDRIFVLSDQDAVPLFFIRATATPGVSRVSYSHLAQAGSLQPGGVFGLSGTGSSGFDGNFTCTSSLTLGNTNRVLSGISPTVATTAGGNTITVSPANAASFSQGHAMWAANQNRLLGMVLSSNLTTGVITLDRGVQFDVATSADLDVFPWFDINKSYTGGSPDGVILACVQNGTNKITTTYDVNNVSAGMSFKADGIFVQYTITNVDTSSTPTVITLSNAFSSKNANFVAYLSQPGALVKPRTTGLYAIYGNYISNQLRNADGTVNYISGKQFSGVSFYNNRDADTGELFRFNMINSDGTALNNITEKNPPLPAPTIASVVKTGSGTVKLTLANQPAGALNYVVTVDGGLTYLPMGSDGTVSGLTAGTLTLQAIAMNAANDLGVGVNPGASSPGYSFTLAA